MTAWHRWHPGPRLTLAIVGARGARGPLVDARDAHVTDRDRDLHNALSLTLAQLRGLELASTMRCETRNERLAFRFLYILAA